MRGDTVEKGRDHEEHGGDSLSGSGNNKRTYEFSEEIKASFAMVLNLEEKN